MVQVMEGRRCRPPDGRENPITGAYTRPIEGAELQDALERVAYSGASNCVGPVLPGIPRVASSRRPLSVSFGSSRYLGVEVDDALEIAEKIDV
jgi:hypothetical protein